MRFVRAIALLVLAWPATVRAAVEAVPTFQSIGVTWTGSGGDAATVAGVRYRPVGSSSWRDGYPLWFDPRDGEYRGSLVGLTPGTAYEIEVSIAGGAAETAMTTTWSEDVPIGSTTTVASSDTTLMITAGGSPTGYALYAPADGQQATIDVADQHDACVFIDAPYVIVRGLTLAGASASAIQLGPNAHDVIIERNDISGFGRISMVDGAGTNWGSNSDAAVYCDNHATVERIVVQRNRIHHPRSDSNNWEEPRPSRGGDPHPLGPQAVTFESCGGNHVFRYNDIYSDADHYFQDGIGGGDNFSFDGFPRNDSDIYGNRISECWDDGIESEGGNRNVRVWGNHIDRTFVKVAVAATSIGPIYIWRNVAGVSRRSDATDKATVDGEDRGPFLKSGSNDPAYQGGRIFVFHNTLLQPVDPAYDYTLGCGYGLADSAGDMTGVFSRNNLLQIHKTWWQSVSDQTGDPSNDFDYDLSNGEILAVAGAEANGWAGVPVYAASNQTDEWFLDPASPGFDVGTRLATFNDDFLGAGPDVGAYEAGGPPLEFGVDAYVDGLPGAPDAGPGGGADGGPTGGDDDGASGGCGCRTNGRSTGAGGLLALLALAFVRYARRR